MKSDSKTVDNNNVQIINLTPDNIAEYGVCGYKNIKKHTELQRKVEWFNKYYKKGLRIKAIVTETGSYQGMIEYIPGEYAHRPVNVNNYMFIHCIFVGFKKDFKGKGYGSLLIDECIKEAKENNMKGVAIVTRKGSFMAKKDIFIKKGFRVVDNSMPDFSLLVFNFGEDTNTPSFKINTIDGYSEGLTIIRSAQCPYSVKNVDAIIKTSKELGLNPRLIELEDHNSAQNVPCAFGTFCIIKDGKILSYHPISNGRFKNIMKAES